MSRKQVLPNDNEFFYAALRDWRDDHPDLADVPVGHMTTDMLSQVMQRAQAKKVHAQLEEAAR